MAKLIERIIRKTMTFFSSIYYVIRFRGFYTISFSQEGEDILLERVFNNQSEGFYVDVGAHHPVRFSNTHHFYQRGWTGINIEPNPDALKLFAKKRSRDINLNIGVGKEKANLEYFMFDEPALNTFDKDVLQDRIFNTSYKYLKTLKIEVKTLAKILEENVPEKIKIDFLSVDVEGLDLDVIKSNDWIQFRPKWVLVEQLNLDDIETLDFEIHDFMKSINYRLFAKTYNTLFYKEEGI